MRLRLSERQQVAIAMMGSAQDAAREWHSQDWEQAGINVLALMNRFGFDFFSEADRLLARLEARGLVRKAATCEVWSLTDAGREAYERNRGGRSEP